jgi:hypothetical protein
VCFAAITICVTSQRVFVVVIYFVMTQFGNFGYTFVHERRCGRVKCLFSVSSVLHVALYHKPERSGVICYRSEDGLQISLIYMLVPISKCTNH